MHLIPECLWGWTIAQKTLKEAGGVKKSLVMLKSEKPCFSTYVYNTFFSRSHGNWPFLLNPLPSAEGLLDYISLFNYTSGLFLCDQPVGAAFLAFFQTWKAARENAVCRLLNLKNSCSVWNCYQKCIFQTKDLFHAKPYSVILLLWGYCLYWLRKNIRQLKK